MKYFNRWMATVAVLLVLCFVVVDWGLLREDTGGRPYRVEAGRLAEQIERYGVKQIDLSEYQYITGIEKYDSAEEDSRTFFEETDQDYFIRQIGGEIYRLEYRFSPDRRRWSDVVLVNAVMGFLSAVVMITLVWIRRKLIKPFIRLSDAPYEMARGNLTAPLPENKSHFWGRFVWGVNLLREHMEHQKERELALQKEKKTLVLSISHDIKTPLSAIKLYAKALCRGLYQDEERQREVAGCINDKADEIENFVHQIIQASREDVLDLEVAAGEFYLSELVEYISDYYGEKLFLLRIPFSLEDYDNCLLKGDRDRGIEVLQNVMENAVKYGDGGGIEVVFSEEEDCRIVTVKNSGCTLPEQELSHIFDSFWRGSNAGKHKGSGLGLSICRQLMQKMDGEVYAEIRDDCMWVHVIFRRA